MTIPTELGPDRRMRCRWALGTPGMLAYHDEEWGFPVDDDRRLFEKLCLEGFQSGLSWRTILEKRESFRRAFHGFDVERVARMTPRDVTRLLGDASIVRHRGKIEAAIHNARAVRELVTETGSLAAFVWSFAPETGATPALVATSPASVALSKALRKRGFRFVGPTTAYAFMQSMGLVNDHAEACVVRKDAVRARKTFRVPR